MNATSATNPRNEDMKADLPEKGEAKPASGMGGLITALAVTTVVVMVAGGIRTPFFPFLLIAGAVGAAAYLWGCAAKLEKSEKEAATLRRTVTDLEERLANVEVINSFEERLAEKAWNLANVGGEGEDRPSREAGA